MASKVLTVLVSLGAAGSGFVAHPPALTFAPLTPLNRSTADPTVTLAYDTHVAFLERIEVRPPYAYSYGYEAEDETHRTKDTHYESRYGDVAFGSRTHLDPDGGRTTVDYTVDTAGGFRAVARKDYPFKPPPAPLGYARLAAPLSFGSHPSPEVYAAHTTLYKDPEAVSKAGPLGVSAYRAHTAFLTHTRLEPPFKYSWGYEVHEPTLGRTRSQYESHYGTVGEGNYALLDTGGIRTIDYTIDDNGFAVAKPSVYTINNYPLIYI